MLWRLGRQFTTFCTRKEVSVGEYSEKQERQFVDQVRLLVRGGNGGNGIYTFHKDKYTRRGPSDGGCGGDGSDVILEANKGKTDLRHFRTKNLIGNSGASGGVSGKDGRTGGKAQFQVPVGTLIYEIKTTAEGEER